MKLNIFCANCQATTAQEVVVKANEISARCGCQRELKWPVMPLDKFKEVLAAQESVNSGQVPVDDQGLSKDGAKFLSDLAGSDLLAK